jgi:hypothetical protein
MWHHRRTSIKAVRAAERRVREDSAPRLKDAVPTLDSLAIRFYEMYGDKSLAEATHVRRIVVDHAPAYFEIPCADRECEGVHDLTQDLLRFLRGARLEFEGAHYCSGGKTARNCGRVLHWTAVATYLRS